MPKQTFGDLNDLESCACTKTMVDSLISVYQSRRSNLRQKSKYGKLLANKGKRDRGRDETCIKRCTYNLLICICSLVTSTDDIEGALTKFSLEDIDKDFCWFRGWAHTYGVLPISDGEKFTRMSCSQARQLGLMCLDKQMTRRAARRSGHCVIPGLDYTGPCGSYAMRSFGLRWRKITEISKQSNISMLALQVGKLVYYQYWSIAFVDH